MATPDAFTPASNSPVRTAWTRVPSPDGDFDAWLTLPPAGHGPGLLLLQDRGRDGCGAGGCAGRVPPVRRRAARLQLLGPLGAARALGRSLDFLAQLF